MTNILRNEWKFTGYVTSDCGGIGHFWRTHRTHPNQESAAADAVLHGTDCECSGKPTYFALQKAIKDGLITEAQIDLSVKRLFTIRFRLGMFDPKDLVPPPAHCSFDQIRGYRFELGKNEFNLGLNKVSRKVRQLLEFKFTVLNGFRWQRQGLVCTSLIVILENR